MLASNGLDRRNVVCNCIAPLAESLIIFPRFLVGIDIRKFGEIEIRSSEHAPNQHIYKPRALQLRPIERRALQLRLLERRALQLRPVERRALQLRITELRALQLRLIERRALQPRLIERRACRSAPVKSALRRSARLSTAERKSRPRKKPVTGILSSFSGSTTKF